MSTRIKFAVSMLALVASCGGSGSTVVAPADTAPAGSVSSGPGSTVPRSTVPRSTVPGTISTVPANTVSPPTTEGVASIVGSDWNAVSRITVGGLQALTPGASLHLD